MIITLLFLLLFFATPMVALAQPNFCYTEESSAQNAREQLIAVCQTYNGIPSINVFLSDAGFYCAGGYCSDCNHDYQNVVIPSCCQLQKAPKPLAFFQCVQVAESGPGITFLHLQNVPNNETERCTDQPHPTCGAESSSSSSSDADESSSSGDGGSSSGGSSGSNGSSDSGGGIANICRATDDELVSIMADLIVDCTTGVGAGNTHTYNIEYMPSESPSAPFCITGGCKYDSGSSSSEGGDGDSSSSSADGGKSSGDGDGTAFISECRPGGEYLEIFVPSYPNLKTTIYNSKPSMLRKEDVSVSSCDCNGTQNFSCVFNSFGLVEKYEPGYVSICGWGEGYWCNGIENGICNFSGSSVKLFYENNTWKSMNISNKWLGGMESRQTRFYTYNLQTGAEIHTSFYHGFILPSNVSYSDLENAALAALPDFPSLNRMSEYCRGEWVPHDDDCFGTRDEAARAAADTAIACRLLDGISSYAAELSGRGWCAVGSCEFDDRVSSSSAESSSSSSDASSSSEAESSSSSSISDSGICPSHPLPSVPQNPLGACFAAGGKCYKCNPARGSECGNSWLWIYNFVPENVGWWYTEIACDGGSVENSSSSGSGGCAPYPLLSTPSDPLNACFATNGKCYKCNPDRGSECSYSWLWSNGFSEGNVGWWYKEIACEGSSNKCQDSPFLPKKSVLEKDLEYAKEDVSYEVWKNKTQVFYDALGRRTQANPKVRRYLFLQKKDKTAIYNDNFDSWNANDNFVSIDLHTTQCYKNSKSGWICEKDSQLSALKKDGNICGIKGEDYAYAKNDGTLVGGYTCTFIEVDYSPKNYIWIPCLDDRSKMQVDFNINFTTTLTRNEPFYVKEGDTFRNSDHIATKEDEIAVRYHELGHIKYNSCLNFPVITKRISGCYCNEEEIKEKIRQEINEIEQKHGKLLDDMSNLFHQKYGTTGYATTYTCPN
jgi:uncharacterized membrane protein YgcG